MKELNFDQAEKITGGCSNFWECEDGEGGSGGGSGGGSTGGGEGYEG